MKSFSLKGATASASTPGTTKPERAIVAVCLNERDESEHVCCVIFAKMKKGPQRKSSLGNWINEQAALCRPQKKINQTSEQFYSSLYSWGITSLVAAKWGSLSPAKYPI